MKDADLLARLLIISLPKISPTRVRWLLKAAEPVEVVERLRKGLLPADSGRAPAGMTRDVVDRWRRELLKLDPVSLLQNQHANGISVLTPNDPRWPFAEDPEPPLVLFYVGDLDLLQCPSALAVVGTRRCTSVGRTVSYGFGHDLATAGVAVISGLALGIDGAAHGGALDAGGPVIGVVGSGLDVVYPGGNRDLWGRVSAAGLMLSECPAGTKPQRWRFPARNRMIAGLSDGVIIVESHHKGGALLTVDETIDRGRAVFVVPGSVLSPASDGTNHLLTEGAVPVRDAEDVLIHLGLAVHSGQPEELPFGGSVAQEPEDKETQDPIIAQILNELTTGPQHIDALVGATGKDVLAVTVAVQRMVADGLIKLDASTVSLL